MQSGLGGRVHNDPVPSACGTKASRGEDPSRSEAEDILVIASLTTRTANAMKSVAAPVSTQ
jgi:hypothetical protein